MIAYLVAAIVAGTSYWNDQLEFGVDVPQNTTICTGANDSPDRGFYIFINNKNKCPDLTKTSLYEYVEKKKISSISVVAWYNAPEGFLSPYDLARAYCEDSEKNLFKKNIKDKVAWFCMSKGKSADISGFFLLNKGDDKTSGVNVRISLKGRGIIADKKYWDLVNTITTSKK